jgi:hypothetical protein
MSRENPMMRLNIYVSEPSIRRRVKAAAARQDISMSEYCLRAIVTQLESEPAEQLSPEHTGSPALREAVERARGFRARVFDGRRFSINSADLISESRERI